MKRACGSLCDLQVGAASTEDEDRLLQGCQPAWRVPESIVRLSRILVPRQGRRYGRGTSTRTVSYLRPDRKR
jgi:hypothetical protein